MDPAVRQRRKLATYRYNARNPESLYNRYLKRVYGVTRAWYDAKLVEQGGVCAICRKSVEKRKGAAKVLFVDHCHATGKARGLLCNTCNAGLGSLRDDIGNLERALAYLKEYSSIDHQGTVG